MTERKWRLYCSRRNPRVKRRGRAEAQEAGTIYYSGALRGWVYPAVERRPVQGPPVFLWTFCPFCGADLPDEVSAVEQSLKDHQQDEHSA